MCTLLFGAAWVAVSRHPAEFIAAIEEALNGQ